MSRGSHEPTTPRTVRIATHALVRPAERPRVSRGGRNPPATTELPSDLHTKPTHRRRRRVPCENLAGWSRHPRRSRPYPSPRRAGGASAPNAEHRGALGPLIPVAPVSAPEHAHVRRVAELVAVRAATEGPAFVVDVPHPVVTAEPAAEFLSCHLESVPITAACR